MDVLNKIDAFINDHKVECSVACFFIAGITAFALVPAFRGTSISDGANAGQFGDFIGGYFGTVFLILSVVLLFGSYRDQRATNRRNLVETRFFEMLGYHRENVADLGIDDGKLGQRVFVSMIREFRAVWKIVHSEDPDYPAPRKLDIAYMAFYYGVGPNSTRILKAALAKNHPVDLVERVTKRLTELQTKYRELEEKHRGNEISDNADTFDDRHAFLKITLNSISYRPFDGHQSRLGHYFRHLYQTAKYIKQHGDDQATDYAGILRAQLSNHEQALLALNSLSEIGKNWRTEKLIGGDFALIKNIPDAFFPIEMVDIKKEFPDIIFEYELSGGAAETTNRSEVESLGVI